MLGRWLVPFLWACGSNSTPTIDAGPTSGVDAGDEGNPRFLVDLSTQEQQQLCDWTADRQGGYDASLVCDSGLVVSTFVDQQQCLGAFLGSCSTVSVSDWEQCVDAVAGAPCDQLLYTSPACANVARCLSGNG